MTNALYPPSPKNSKKNFSIHLKLILIFGVLIAISCIMQNIFGVHTARQAVTEKIQTLLINKANDTSEIIDARIIAFWQFLEGIARMPELSDPTISAEARSILLDNEVAFNKDILILDFTDTNGIRYTTGGKTILVSDREWFNSAISGKRYVAEPIISRRNNKLNIIFSVPIYTKNKNIIGVLVANVDGNYLCNVVDDIVVGKTGYAYINGITGTTIAHKNFELVKSMRNRQKAEDSNINSIAKFEKKAQESKSSDIAFYEYKNIARIASYAKIKSTGWTIIVVAPIHEFMDAVDQLQNKMRIIAIVILVIALIVVFFTAQMIVKPINIAVDALHNIAQGEGDLTVRLPLHGNDEITHLSECFNQTIEKIASSIKSVDSNTTSMRKIGDELATNMNETASAMHQINANIDGVKEQTLTQSASVTETVATMEEIIRTIKQLNGSIENQASSVAISSSSIEQMVANITSITKTLSKADDLVKKLADATADGKVTVITSGQVTQKISEESGGLMEASNVIQHIASQTNLLAMNAAIEAAHAGESGKGFAVVADEIRKLAEESSTQGKNITSTLKSLGAEIESLTTASKVSEEKFNIIFELSEQVKKMSTDLSTAMKEQEHGSKEVLAAIRDINTVTDEVQAGSQEMLRGGEGVASEMQKLDALTRVITDKMNEMAFGAEQINKAIQEVNELTQKSNESVTNLAQEVDKFKL